MEIKNIDISHSVWHEIFSGARRLRVLSSDCFASGDCVVFTSGASESRPYLITKHQPHLVGCYVEFIEAN